MQTGRRPRALILLDGMALSGLMVRYNIGVQDQQTYVIKRVDEDFFDAEFTLQTQRPRGTSRGTAGREIPVQSVLQVRSIGRSAAGQATRVGDRASRNA